MLDVMNKREREREAGVFDYIENWLGEGLREMARPFCCQFSVDLMDVYEYQMEQKNSKPSSWKLKGDDMGCVWQDIRILC